MFNACAHFYRQDREAGIQLVIAKHLSCFLTTGGAGQHWMLIVGAAVFKGAQKSSDG